MNGWFVGPGLKNVHMSWGHDEYLYQVCVRNGSTLPEQALYMIRLVLISSDAFALVSLISHCDPLMSIATIHSIHGIKKVHMVIYWMIKIARC
jgi:hypothetical protein